LYSSLEIGVPKGCFRVFIIFVDSSIALYTLVLDAWINILWKRLRDKPYQIMCRSWSGSAGGV
jgi:hypothetical protein